jgi:putative sugar O-methyltransferase
VFNIFKSISTYTDILEHVTYEEGKEYSDLAFLVPEIKNNIEKFACNDTYGSPKTYQYSFGVYSPTTLRYIKILSELSQLNLNDKTIVEIGAGYGGQYVTMRQMYKPRKYIFVDLPEVLELIKKYVSKHNLNDIEIEYHDAFSLKEIKSDLVISNYAFSECTKDIQNIYIEKLIKNSKHGYMLYNNMEGYTHDDFKVKSDKKIKVFAETPKTHPKNVLLTW